MGIPVEQAPATSAPRRGSLFPDPHLGPGGAASGAAGGAASGAATKSAAAGAGEPPSLAEICATLGRELGVQGDMPTIVDAACGALGVAAKGTLLEKAHACWRTLGAHGGRLDERA